MSDEQQPEQSSNQSSSDISGEISYRVVPAMNGVLWIKRAITLFRIAPSVWTACAMLMIFAFFFLLVITMIIPLLLPLLFIGSAIFTGGLMLGCHRLHLHQSFNVGFLLAGYRSHAKDLIMVGLFYFFGTVISYILAMTISQGIGYEVYPVDMNQLVSDEVEAQKFIDSLIVPLIIMMLFMVPVFMAFWFSPALVVFFNESPLQAFKKSLFACASNLMAFLVFGLTAFFALVIISSLLQIIAGAIPAAGFLLNFIFNLIFTCLSVTAIYAAFDDIFPVLAIRTLKDNAHEADHLVA